VYHHVMVRRTSAAVAWQDGRKAMTPSASIGRIAPRKGLVDVALIGGFIITPFHPARVNARAIASPGVPPFILDRRAGRHASELFFKNHRHTEPAFAKIEADKFPEHVGGTTIWSAKMIVSGVARVCDLVAHTICLPPIGITDTKFQPDLHLIL